MNTSFGKFELTLVRAGPSPGRIGGRYFPGTPVAASRRGGEKVAVRRARRVAVRAEGDPVPFSIWKNPEATAPDAQEISGGLFCRTGTFASATGRRFLVPGPLPIHVQERGYRIRSLGDRELPG